MEELRKKIAVKQEEVAAAKQECDRRGTQVAALQAEIEKQAGVIRDMQVREREQCPGSGMSFNDASSHLPLNTYYLFALFRRSCVRPRLLHG